MYIINERFFFTIRNTAIRDTPFENQSLVMSVPISSIILFLTYKILFYETLINVRFVFCILYSMLAVPSTALKIIFDYGPPQQPRVAM